jgi:putative Mg2+ transporter-C (MgtC) family protein
MSVQLEVLAEVALAMLLGGIIGVEREVANKPAGFRTHMLVSGAAALLVGLSFALIDELDRYSPIEAIAADPVRIIQAVVLGVGFLAGGTIFRSRHRENVKGLTTAASLLMASGIGIAVALRQFVLAVGTTALVTFVLYVIGRIEGRTGNRQD